MCISISTWNRIGGGGTRNPIRIGRSLRQSMMTYFITNFVLTTTTKTAMLVRGKKKVMEEEAKQETRIMKVVTSKKNPKN